MNTFQLGKELANLAVVLVAIACSNNSASQTTVSDNASGGMGSLDAEGGIEETGTGGGTSVTSEISGGADSGLGTTRLINQLTKSEMAELCAILAPSALEVSKDPDKSRGSCVLHIVQTAFTHVTTTLEECQSALDACDTATVSPGQPNISGAVPSLVSAAMACVSSTPDINPTCRSSVAEVEQCFTAGFSTLAAANDFTCTTIMSGDAARQVASILGNSGVLACQGYQSKCPNGIVVSMNDAGN